MKVDSSQKKKKFKSLNSSYRITTMKTPPIVTGRHMGYHRIL